MIDISSDLEKFEQLDVDCDLKERLCSMGMVVMTPVQKRCIPHLLNGKDLLGAAKTGSGKTLAFLVPLVEKVVRLSEGRELVETTEEKMVKIEKDRKDSVKKDLKNLNKKVINHALGTQGIILSPTRELSIQTFKVLEALVEGSGLRAGLIIGGNKRDEEANYLRQGIEILVATPGRLLDHLNNTKEFKYNSLHTLVIDEADRLMNQGFLDDMKAIIRKLPKLRQTVLFSATLNVNSAKLKNKMKKIKERNEGQKLNVEEKVLTLASISLKESCVCVDITAEDLSKGITNESLSTVSQLMQSYVICKEDDRFRILCTLLQRNQKKKMMIFMSTCKEVNFYFTLLNILKPMFIEGVTLMVLQGKQKQSKREQCFETFRNSKRAVLLCTDVAARGLDIPLVDMVVQFDPPEDHKEYIHRVGRTARNGNAGQALIFLRNHEFNFISVLKRENVPVEGVDIVESSILPIQSAIDKVLENYAAVHATAKEAFKTVVSAYVSNPNKHCFDINKLDLKALARNFGLTTAPQVYVPINVPKKMKKREAGMNSDDDNYYIPSKISRH